jgi:hypothetical protein
VKGMGLMPETGGRGDEKRLEVNKKINCRKSKIKIK